MKKLRITVNQTVYDVTVVVLEDDEQIATGAGYLSPLPPAPRTAAPAAAAPKPAAAPVTAPGAPPTRLVGDPNAILAPIAGVVQKVFVQVGSHVDAKAPVAMLDAMKMDTYIYAPRPGNISEVCVAPGDSVQVGDYLIRYAPEA